MSNKPNELFDLNCSDELYELNELNESKELNELEELNELNEDNKPNDPNETNQQNQLNNRNELNESNEMLRGGFARAPAKPQRRGRRYGQHTRIKSPGEALSTFFRASRDPKGEKVVILSLKTMPKHFLNNSQTTLKKFRKRLF